MFPTLALEAVTPESITQAVDLFEIVKQLRLRLTNINEEILDKAFETHIQGVLEKLDKRIPLLTNENAKKVEVVMAKHGLCDATFQQVILLCQNISPALSDVLKQLRSIHSEYFSELQHISNLYLQNIQESQKICEESKIQVQNIEEECNQLLEATKLLDKEAEENNQLILDLRKQLRETLAEVNSAKIIGKKNNWKNQSNNLSSTTTTTTTLSSTLTSVNGIESIPRPSFDTSIQADIRGRKLFDNMKKSDPHIVGNNSSSQTFNSTLQSESKALSSSMSSTFSPLASLSTLSQWLLTTRKEIQTTMDTGSIRSMSINECRDLVMSLLDSRIQFLNKINQKIDNLRRENDGSPLQNPKISNSSTISSLCPDTLEVFVYQTMEKKYGLRSLAVEHSAMLLSAVERYRQQDFSIRLFHTIFRNLVEEEYRSVLDELKKSVKDLLVVGLMSRFPQKDQSTIESLLSDKMNGEIDESEWSSIVSYLYHSKDATTLRLLLRQEVNRLRQERGESLLPLTSSSSLSSSSSPSSTSKSGRSHTPNKQRSLSNSSTPHKSQLKSNTNTNSNSNSISFSFILPFSVFMNCLLDFQLSNHLKYLEGFQQIFISCDTDRDGILSNDEFEDCFTILRNSSVNNGVKGSDGKVEINEEEEEEMMRMVQDIVDPLHTGRISFTSMASCFNQIGKRMLTSSSTNNNNSHNNNSHNNTSTPTSTGRKSIKSAWSATRV